MRQAAIFRRDSAGLRPQKSVVGVNATVVLEAVVTDEGAKPRPLATTLMGQTAVFVVFAPRPFFDASYVLADMAVGLAASRRADKPTPFS